MPPKKKAIAEPNVNSFWHKIEVPDGDATAGREVFDQHCSACHALEGTTIIIINSSK